MQMSHSRVETFNKCPYQFKLRYIDGLRTKFNLDPTNALALGTAMHEGIEKDVESAIHSYYSNYPTATPLMVNEAIKLEVMIGKAKERLGGLLENGQFEVKIDHPDFIGFIDLLVPVEGESNTFDIYDFKYSNNVENYLESSQLHLYKHFFELTTGKRVRNLAFVFIPKVKLKQDQDEDLSEYRRRLIEECKKQKIIIVHIERYDPIKVIDFLLDAKHCIECEDYDKNPTKLCYWCDYQQYCASDGQLDGRIIYPQEER